MTQSAALKPRAASAPGKVLLAGGYLVLDRQYTGLVFGLDARIHVHVQPIPTSSGVTLSEIIVKSPQFDEATWEYGYRLNDNDGGIVAHQLRASAHHRLHANPFIETALSFALSYIASVFSPHIDPASITIFADDDYYTRPAGQLKETNSRFVSFGVPLWEAHKTGLGSSAALVTAFTAAVLSHYLPGEVFSLSSDDGRRKLHNLAQAAHCAAQGKVGSGFDVASAVYGSCLYRRFSPSILESLGEPGSKEFARRLRAAVDESDQSHTWDTEISKAAVAIPSGLRLVMCDVDCGSQTPGMVKKVLAWRKDSAAEAADLWQKLQQNNEALAGELVRLHKESSQDFGKLRTCIQNIRQLIRDMSKHSGVPIEPESQTHLIDACTGVEGVIGGVVPGAGGYDAIVLLIEDKDQVVARLKSFLAEWNRKQQSSKETDIGKVSLLGVRAELEGARLEDEAQYGLLI